MKKWKALRNYAAIMTGLALDMFVAGALGWFSEFEIMGIAFAATLLFIIGFAIVMIVTDPGQDKKMNQSQAPRKCVYRKDSKTESVMKSVKKRLPWFVRNALMRRKWKKMSGNRRGGIRRVETKPLYPKTPIYKLEPDMLKFQSKNDVDFTEYKTIWNARPE